MKPAAQQRGFLWVLFGIGLINVVVAGLALRSLSAALRERRLPAGRSYDVDSLSGGATEARDAVETWETFTATGQATSGDLIARSWLVVDVGAFTLLGYGLVALATLLLAKRALAAQKASNARTLPYRLFVVAGALGLLLVIIDVVETVLTWAVLEHDGNGPATFLDWWTTLKWVVAVAMLTGILIAAILAVVAVLKEQPVSERIKMLFTGAWPVLTWAGQLLVTAAFLAASIAVLAVLAARGAHPAFIAVVGIGFAYAAFRFNAALEARRQQDDTARVFVYLRVAIDLELIVIGLCLAISWTFASPPAGFGFVGLVATLFGASGLLGEFRWNHSSTRKKIAIALVILAGVVAIAALLVPDPVDGILLLFIAIFVLGMVGLSSVTEDVLRRLANHQDYPGDWLTSHHRWVFPVAGAALATLATAWAVADDWTTRNLVLGGAVLVVFALVVGSNWSSEAFIAVGAVVIIWALSPSVGQITQTVLPESGDEVMVVLGDSYTSGEGGSTFFEGTNTSRAAVENKCRRSVNAASVRLAENPADPVPSQIVFVACSGATLGQITTEAQYVGEPPSGPTVERDGVQGRGLNQLEHVTWINDNAGGTFDIDTVLVGTGGNDAGFGDVVALCVLPGDCSELVEQWIGNLQTLRPRMEATFRTIRQHFGDDAVYVAMPYPVPIGPQVCGQSHYTANEHRFLFNYVAALNLAVTEAAANTGFHVVEDVQNAFITGGNGICTGTTRGDLGINYLAAGQEGGVFEDQLNPMNCQNASTRRIPGPLPRGWNQFASTRCWCSSVSLESGCWPFGSSHSGGRRSRLAPDSESDTGPSALSDLLTADERRNQ